MYVRWLCEQPARNMVRYFPLIQFYKNRTPRKMEFPLPAGLRDMGEPLP